MSDEALAARAEASRRWLFDDVFPLWSTAGFDAGTGQFVEKLNLDGTPVRGTRRRLLVQARQIFAFVAAGRMGWAGPWREVAGAAADAMLARGRNKAGDWIFSFDEAGQPADRRGDLYTQAFAIFGLAHAASSLQRDDLLGAARATCARLETGWSHAAGGFAEGEIEAGRRQNPHMHLLEAYLALYAASGEAEDLARAEAMAALFERRLLNAEPVGLIEFFEDDWSPVRPIEVWPGHHYEWAWLLGDLARADGADRGALVAAITARADAVGVGPHGAVVDAVGLDGSPVRTSARLWPQTERLKARMSSAGGVDTRAALGALDCLERYFDTPRAGLWRDRLLPDGSWEDGPAPASSAYHIVSALERLIAGGVG